MVARPGGWARSVARTARRPGDAGSSTQTDSESGVRRGLTRMVSAHLVAAAAAEAAPAAAEAARRRCGRSRSRPPLPLFGPPTARRPLRKGLAADAPAGGAGRRLRAAALCRSLPPQRSAEGGTLGPRHVTRVL